MNLKSRSMLEELFEAGSVRLERSSLFDSVPPSLPASFTFDRIEGMMLGLAVGDSLGKTSESMTPRERRATFGTIVDYQPHPVANNRCVGLPSDDTQLAYWTLEQLIKDQGLDPESVARAFCRGRIYGLGQTVHGFIRNFKSGSMPWYECGPHSAGNGALMRIAPILIPHLRKPSPDLWADTALCAMITHNDATSTSSCLAFIYIIWHVLGMEKPPEPTWWLETYVGIARELEGHQDHRPRGGDHVDYTGPLWKYVERIVAEAYDQELSVHDACESWYSGAYLMETVPSVLYILMRHGDDLEEALIRAVNDTRDNDTIAAIVGAVLGAFNGKKGIPSRWLENLLGRTRENDDGRVFKLLDRTRLIFWEKEHDSNDYDNVKPEDIGTEDHMRKVDKWLRENTQVYNATKRVILRNFSVDWKNISGSFYVIFDDVACPEKFRFGYGYNGRVGYSGPMFVSPLGAPASYSAVEFNVEADVAITRGLAKVLPEIKAFGSDRETGKLITTGTPFEERLPPIEAIEALKNKFQDPLFSIEIEITPSK